LIIAEIMLQFDELLKHASIAGAYVPVGDQEYRLADHEQTQKSPLYR
jgi:hypothetical protein